MKKLGDSITSAHSVPTQKSVARTEMKAADTRRARAARNSLSGVLRSTQSEVGDLFKSSLYSQYKLIPPPYNPSKLYLIAESSAILPQCIDAMVRNCDGFGNILEYIGDESQAQTPRVKSEKESIMGFFERVNETQSFTTLRQQLRRDLETTGNGYMEVVRTESGEIGCLYFVDSRYVRIQTYVEKPVEVKFMAYRGGKEREMTVSRRFRKYAMLSEDGKTVRWFKEFGDPRSMDPKSGKYSEDANTPPDSTAVALARTLAPLDPGFPQMAEANELIHFKIGNGVYGVPRWTGQVLGVLGMTNAEYVNYDLFINQGIPPLAILVSGGSLAEESVQDIKEILEQKKGVKNFNKVVILEAMPDGNITDSGTTKVDFKELSSRKEDAMFVVYQEKGEARVRTAFRLPDLYIGRSEAYSKSTADSSRMVAEEQIFVPIRKEFDEIINVLILNEFKASYWRFKSNGPRLITGDSIVQGFDTFAKNGVFSFNDGVKLANQLLGTDITPYTSKWGDLPIALVLALAKAGLIDQLRSAVSQMFGEAFAEGMDLTTTIETVTQEPPQTVVVNPDGAPVRIDGQQTSPRQNAGQSA